MMRKAGDLIGALINTVYSKDKQYANFIANKLESSGLGDNVKALGIMGAGSALGDIRIPDNHGLTGRDLLLNRGIVGGALASNAGIRYGVPLVATAGIVQGVGGLFNTPVPPQDQTNQMPY